MSAVTLRGEEASWDLYTVTSNHVHLIIRDAKGEEVIPQTIQLIARRTVREYNQRKDRRGAFWEDRYHATAVERWIFI
jgi:REP element-mobilizing transposase RayT